MKIITKPDTVDLKNGIKKILLTMKLTILLMFLSVFYVSGTSIYSQNLKISLNMQDATVRDVIKEVEKQGNMSFFFNDELQELNTRISISQKDKPVYEVLQSALSQANMTFQEIKDNFVVLLPVSDSNSPQPARLTGRVTDSKTNEPLIGVNVVIEGTTTGTITNTRGEYTLEGVRPENVVVFSFIGYVSQKVTVGNNTVLNISFVPELEALEEVVVVGYGTQRKRDVTGSIARVTGDDIIQPSTLSFDQMLQGKVAGVTITQTTGAPGGNVNVLVRGISSITGGNQPLYVVDGYPIGTGGGGADFALYGYEMFTAARMSGTVANRVNPLSTINPADIESIEVLKDASATAIYGSRGANGVVIITTKRGALGKSQINVDASYGIQEIAHKLDLMNSKEYAQYVCEGRDNAWVYLDPLTHSADDPNEVRGGSQKVPPAFRDPESITVNTDWQDVIFQRAPVQNYQISSTAGTDKTKFYISGGLYDQEGIILSTYYKRFNIRANIDSKVSERLNIGTSLMGTYGHGRFQVSEGHYGEAGILTMVAAAAPTIPAYDDKGKPYFNRTDMEYGLGWLANPLDVINGFSDKRKVADILMNNYVEYKILEGLVFRSSIGVKYATNTTKLWRTSAVPRETTLNFPATGAATKYETFNWLNENTLNYKYLLNGKHMFDALIGISEQKESWDRLSAGASDFPTEYVPYISAGIVSSGVHQLSEWSIVSLISRLQYSYSDKYMVTATIRRDGSSRFGKNNKWGTFPSISFGYNISEEPFMESVDFINVLKLRASYGLAGNNQIGNYSHIALLSTSNYVLNNTKLIGLVPSTLSNDDLTWEKSKQMNLGLDMSFLNDRIALTADIYKDNKVDLLLQAKLPSASGFSSSMLNVGEVENKGFELNLNTVNIRANKFEWRSNFTFSTNKNKVLKLTTEGERIIINTYQVAEAGYPISSYYLLHTTGVFMNAQELVGAPKYTPKNVAGDLKFEDHNKDSTITLDDRYVVGDPWPDYIWGFNNSFTYGNLTLNISLNGTHGGYNYLTWNNSAGVQNQIKIGKRWVSEENPGDGRWPRAIRNNYAYGFGTYTDLHMYDNSYVRIRNVNLTYRLPQSIVSKIKLSGLQVYFDIANLVTWTDYPGFDPESNSRGDNIVATGQDNLTYPLSRTYTVGLKASF